MGNSSSQELEKSEVIFQVENQVQIIRNEVEQQQPLITENVKQELTMQQDTMALRYSDLKNIEEVSKNIQAIFKDEVAVEFLTAAAQKMIAVFRSSSAMKELSRWNQVKKILRSENIAIGMELHYKVTIAEEKAGMFALSKDTVVVLGYKFIQHQLTIDPSSLPDHQKLKSLRF